MNFIMQVQHLSNEQMATYMSCIFSVIHFCKNIINELYNTSVTFLKQTNGKNIISITCNTVDYNTDVLVRQETHQLWYTQFVCK